MAEHGGKDPISSTSGTLVDGIVGILKMGLIGGTLFGLATGLVPKIGNIWSPLDLGSVIGSVFNTGVNTFTSVFMPSDSMQKLKRINGESLPDQRLMNPSTPPSATILPTSSRTQNSSVVEQSVQKSFVYEDPNGDGIITPEEIAAQNKARN